MEQDLIYIWDNGQEYSAHETYFIKSDLTKHQVENIFDITEMSIGLIGIVKSLDWRTSFSSMQYLLFHEISHKLELAQLGFGWKDTCPVAIKQKEKEDAFKYSSKSYIDSDVQWAQDLLKNCTCESYSKIREFLKKEF